VLSGDFYGRLRGAPGRIDITSDDFEDRREVIDVGLGAGMIGFERTR
jgi:hypothetical protein